MLSQAWRRTAWANCSDRVHARPIGDPNLSVSELAQAAGLSPLYFMRGFLNATGMTAHSYLVQLRLNAARARLAAGGEAADVAAECRFFDQGHLIQFGTSAERMA